MKKLILGSLLSVYAILCFSQPSPGLNFQGVLRDDNGLPVPNTSATVNVKVVTDLGLEVYSETHNATTDPFGAVFLRIGDGENTNGDLKTTDFGKGEYNLEVNFNANGITMSTSQEITGALFAFRIPPGSLTFDRLAPDVAEGLGDFLLPRGEDNSIGPNMFNGEVPGFFDKRYVPKEVIKSDENGNALFGPGEVDSDVTLEVHRTNPFGIRTFANSLAVEGSVLTETGLTTGVSGTVVSDDGAGVQGAHLSSGASGSLGTKNAGVVGWDYDNPAIWAAYFFGAGTFTGALFKASGAFRIDHPLDPENKYLNHSFVESPDMKNIYDGVVILDNNGEAVVTLPEWFESLNKDFRYQLTCIGGFANVYVAEKVQDNQFKIDGGSPGLEVSWQLTGIRKDAYANENRIEVEVLKDGTEKGRYLHPEAFGVSKKQGIKFEEQQRMVNKNLSQYKVKSQE